MHFGCSRERRSGINYLLSGPSRACERAGCPRDLHELLDEYTAKKQPS